MYYAFTPNTVFKLVSPLGSEPTCQTSMLYSDIVPLLKEINPGISLEGMMLKLKLQYFGHLMWRVDSLEKTDAGRYWGQEEKGTTEDEMAGWHHRLDGRESEWTPGVGDGQGGLACCDSWGLKEPDTTERLNWKHHDNDWIWQPLNYPPILDF